VRPLAWCSRPRSSAALLEGTLAIETLAFIVAGYLAGSLPFGYWVVRWTKGVDIRNVGSGNIGATNVWRTFGPRYAIPVIVLDVLKGFVPALVATLAVGHVAGALAGGAAMLGHWRPLFLRFAKGGKMVATCGGALLGLAPLVGLIGAVVWIIVFALTRYASVSSIVAAASLPVGALLLGEPWPVLVFSSAAALGVLVLHRGNLARLRAGTETRVQLRRKPAATT
jgi:glycerol-3-phosphate acyltransferase PlsY